MLEQAETQRKTEPATGCQLFTIELIDHSTVSASSEKVPISYFTTEEHIVSTLSAAIDEQLSIH